MAKLLLLVAVVAAVLLLVKNYQRSLERQQTEGEPRARKDSLEDMVRCAQCGVHLPRSESFLSRGRYFCSDEHRKLGPARRERGE
ncbi:MAG: preprotein translocase subunit YajC [Betaproteobacteria bacterium]|nr:preprotein translocase subunit YajC [Betaproteobacteria bacterium]